MTCRIHVLSTLSDGIGKAEAGFVFFYFFYFFLFFLSFILMAPDGSRVSPDKEKRN